MHLSTVARMVLAGLAIAVCAPPTPTLAQAPGATPVPPAFSASSRPRIGLVLGGGGAKGFAHIGVIEELERRKIPVDVISGTSMGAVVGSMYAIGNDATEIKLIAESIDWNTIFNDSLKRSELSFRRKRENRDILLDARLGVIDGKPALPKGVLGGQRLFATVQSLLAPWESVEDFNALPIPFRAVATDIITGKHVVMGSGNMSTAVFASMSIPAGFPPVKREGLLLVDGSISDNLPVDVARAMGVDVVIVVDVGAPPASTPEEITSALSVVSQMQSLLGWDAIRRQRESIKGRDVLIEPEVATFGVTAFNRKDDGIELGRQAAQKQAAKLDALSVSDAEWALYLAERKARTRPQPVRIDTVKIANDSNIPTEELIPLVGVKPGDTLDGQVMAKSVAKIFALDEFQRVDYSVELGPPSNTLIVNARRNSATDRYLQAGMILGSNFGRTSTFDLAFGYTDRSFLDTGAEFRGFAQVGNDVQFDVSLYKKFGSYFVEPLAGFERYASLLTRAGTDDVLASLQVSRLGFGVDGGKVFGNWGEFRAGFRIGGVKPDEDGISLGVPSGWSTDIDWRAGFTVDTLDSLTFPREGVYAQLQFIDHVTLLGGNFTRSNLSLDVQKPISWDRLTLVLGGRMAATNNAIPDFIGDFRLGGFLNMSGLLRNSLIGQQLLFGRGVGYYRISGDAPIFGVPLYLGGSLEAGNVWSLRNDITLGGLRTAASAFVAADTPLGPLWFAYGRSGDEGSFYLVLGRAF